MKMNQWDAAAEGRLQRMKTIIKSGVKLDAQDLFQMTALDYAVLNGRTDIVKLLVENGADVNFRSDGETPLYKAISQGNRVMTKLLLDLGSTTQTTRIPNKYEGAWTPLQRAKMFVDQDIVKMVEDKQKEEESNGVKRKSELTENGSHKKSKSETDSNEKEKEAQTATKSPSRDRSKKSKAKTGSASKKQKSKKEEAPKSEETDDEKPTKSSKKTEQTTAEAEQ